MEINAQFKPYLDNVVRILALHKVKNAYLFGSVLTDRFNSSSDVDFLVNYDPSMDPVGTWRTFIGFADCAGGRNP